MSVYADTGLLCSLYLQDAGSKRAIATVQREEPPIAFLGAERFLSFDKRQRSLARAAGLVVAPAR